VAARKRRKAANGFDFLDDMIDSAIGNVVDRVGDVVERTLTQQRAGLSHEQLEAEYTCAACRKSFTGRQLEMVHPNNGYCLCKPCFRFLWTAGEEKLRQAGKRAARGAAAGASGSGQRGPEAAPSPSVTPPWEILGVSEDASVEDIKKAYRKAASIWHPDLVPPGAPSDQKQRHNEKFLELTRARDVMLKVRGVG
jgi:hypothetical protein